MSETSTAAATTTCFDGCTMSTAHGHEWKKYYRILNHCNKSLNKIQGTFLVQKYSIRIKEFRKQFSSDTNKIFGHRTLILFKLNHEIIHSKNSSSSGSTDGGGKQSIGTIWWSVCV